MWEDFIQTKLSPFEKKPSEYFKYWYIESRENSQAYPSQGLLTTPYDFLPIFQKGILPLEKMMRILRVRQYFLELFNHPERLANLQLVQNTPFTPPPVVQSAMMSANLRDEVAVSPHDLGIAVTGGLGQRISRSERLLHGPFVKLGKYARSVLVGSAMPDVYGSVYSLSTMAQCMCLTGVPRNGPFSQIQRQADLVTEVWRALEQSEVLADRPAKEAKLLLKYWRHNLMGVLEAESEKALRRAKALYEVGIRTFRVYSPEPGKDVIKAVKVLRKKYGSEIEIFAGQVVDVAQAQAVEAAGADGLYIGIGGGGRCITGVRSGSVIDWPGLVWRLRGAVSIPIIVEGGASDNIAVTLALGASGIGVSRIAAGGTIESPGGMLYCLDNKGRYFKPYGGEASARTKYLDHKMLPFEIPSFVEGETSIADMNHVPFGVPTIPFNIYNLTEDIILSLVFRGVTNVSDFHALDPSPLRLKTSAGSFSQRTH